MRETEADLERLQALLDDSARRATPFLRRSFEIPEHSLSAEQLAARLRGALTVALATVTASGEPRVAPVRAFLLRGELHVPTVAEAARARHLARRAAASLTCFEDIGFALIAHGTVEIIPSEDSRFAELDEMQVRLGNQSVLEWQGRGIYLHLRAHTLLTYARNPDRFPSLPPAET